MILKYFLAILISLAFVQEGKAQSSKSEFYGYDGKILSRNKSDVRIKDNDKIAAYKQLIKDGDKALNYKPVSVMEKSNNPPSGDKHDYMSLAPYFWPDSSKPGGLPYMRRDGVTNPEVKEYKDKDYLPKVCDNIETLGLAYYFSEDEKYAQHATDLIKVWFLDKETKMNPNLNYGQAIKGRNDGRGAGIIDSRQLIKVVNAVGLLNASSAWKKTYDKELKQWFSDFLYWLETSKNGIDEANATNNHGMWYDAQRVSFAAYVGDKKHVLEIIKNAAVRLDTQMNEQGFFPKELERTISLHYSAFILDAHFIIAQVAANNGIDYYNMKTATGKSLRQAYDAHAPFFKQEKVWTGQQIKKWDPEEAYMILMEAAKVYKCRDCLGKINEWEADKASRLRLKLLY